MGMGRGMSLGAITAGPQQEPSTLKAQSQMLVQQMNDMQRRIEELEKKDQ
jgi:hypothetical protein